ncbi:MAG: hypothetical protein CMJ46_16085 [Planctomyces sp.]|nr:hypothetical protein [Planctomyces sp.]
MSLQVACPQGHRLKISEQHAGKKVRCPKCETVFRVPAAGEVAAATASKPTTAKKPAAKPATSPKAPTAATAKPAPEVKAAKPAKAKSARKSDTEKKSSTMKMVMIVGLILILAGGGAAGYLYFMNNPGDDGSDFQVTMPTQRPTAEPES